MESKMTLTNRILATLLLMVMVLLPSISALPRDTELSIDFTYPQPSGNITNEYINNTYINQTLELNSTQFETGEPATIKTSWLTQIIEGISKWANYWTRTENINQTGYNISADYYFGNASYMTGIPTPDLSGLVPYTGATQDVNLNNKSLSTRGFVYSKIKPNTTKNDGTVSGGVTIEDGAMKGEGTADYISGTGDFSSLKTGNTFTGWFWINETQSQNFPTILNIGNSSTDRIALSLRAGGERKFEYVMVSANSVVVQKRSNDVYTNNGWNYLTTTWNGSFAKIFLNGNEITSFSINTNNYNDMTIATGFQLMARSGSLVTTFVGSLDDTLIFNRALSQAEITQLYNQGRGKYSSVTNGLVAQYSGRDFAGTAEAPTTIYDTNDIGAVDITKYAELTGAVFSGTITASNLNGTNTGDQDLSPYALISNLVSLVGNWTADKINYYTKSEVYNKSETYNQSEVNVLLSSAGNSSFNQSLTDSLYFKVGQNINAPTINLTINNFNMTGEFRYDTNNVFGYTLPSRTLDVYKTEFGDGSIPSGSAVSAARYTLAADYTSGTQFGDAIMTIAGQATGLTTTNNIPAKNLRKFTLSVSVPTDAGHKTVVGCYSSSTSNDLNTVDTGVFYYEEDNKQWNAKCCESGSCTNININYSINSDEFVWLDIISNAPSTINGQATMFSFYLNNVYKGNCTSNLPTYYNRCGAWLENTNTFSDTILYDFAYIESTRVA